MKQNVQYLPITSLLKNIIDNRGKTVPSSSNGIPLIATNCIKHSSIYPTFEKIRFVDEYTFNTWFRAHLEPNDILFVNKGTPGRVCLVPNPVTFCAAQDMMGFRCDENLIDYKYLFAVLRSNEIQQKIENYHVGVVIPHFRKQDLSNLMIPMRDREIQEKIGNCYYILSEKIELNNRINAELEAMAKTLYDYWFVQFDFPNAEGKPYKSSGGAMVWSEELKREIPLGWKVKMINQIIEVKDGTHDSPKSTEFGYKLITSKNLKVEGLDFNSANFISENDYFDINKRSKVETGDILFSMIGNIGTVYKVEEEEINFAIKNVALYKTSQNDNYKNYIYMYLRSIDMDRYLKNEISGSIQKFIGLGSLRNMPLLMNEMIIREYVKKTNPFFLQLENIKQENQQLAHLRDWLLPMLMNGQVVVE